WMIQMYAKQAAINKRARRVESAKCDLCMWKPRLFWSEKKVSIRNRLAYRRHASSAEAIFVSKYSGALYPFAQQQRSRRGPEAVSVTRASLNATSVPGLIQDATVSHRKLSPSHRTVMWLPVRTT